MSLYALLAGWLPGLALVAWGVKVGLDKEQYVPQPRQLPPVGRTDQEGMEVWSSPFSAPPLPPEPRTFHDFGTGRIAAGGCFLLLGVLITAHVYPFAGSEARDTTRIAFPARLLELRQVGDLPPGDARSLKRFSEHRGVDQADTRAYGTVFPGHAAEAPLSAFPLIVFAARGDLPDTKVEDGPGGMLLDLTEESLGSGTRVPHGPMAEKAYCWSLAPRKGYGCELSSRTFFVAVVDQRATSMEEAAERAQDVVAHVVHLKGRPAPDDDEPAGRA